MAAATVAALSADLADDQLAVVAFWSDAALLTPLEEPMPAARLLDLLLRVPARGLTNVHFALTVAQAELARSAARRRSAVLLTDAVHNAGPDPRLVARRFPELHVLLQTDGEHDVASRRRPGPPGPRPLRAGRDPPRRGARAQPRAGRANPKASLHFRRRRVFISGDGESCRCSGRAGRGAARVIASVGT